MEPEICGNPVCAKTPTLKGDVMYSVLCKTYYLWFLRRLVLVINEICLFFCAFLAHLCKFSLVSESQIQWIKGFRRLYRLYRPKKS